MIGGLAASADSLISRSFGFPGTPAQEKPDSHLPRLAVPACPVGDRQHAVRRVIAKGDLVGHVLQPPGTDLDAVLVAHLKEFA